MWSGDGMRNFHVASAYNDTTPITNEEGTLDQAGELVEQPKGSPKCRPNL